MGISRRRERKRADHGAIRCCLQQLKRMVRFSNRHNGRKGSLEGKGITSTIEGLTRALVAVDGLLLSECDGEEIVQADLRNADGVSRAGFHEEVMGSIKKGVVLKRENLGTLASFADEVVDVLLCLNVVIEI